MCEHLAVLLVSVQTAQSETANIFIYTQYPVQLAHSIEFRQGKTVYIFMFLTVMKYSVETNIKITKILVSSRTLMG